MEITKEQIKELVKIAQAIDAENRIDNDVTGGYVEEPYNSIIERIYTVVNECEGKEVDARENTLPIQRVVGSALKDDERVHYEALQDCCKKILKAVDSGKVPQRGIMGLRLLMTK